MAQLDFYANKQDMFDVIDYMFELSPMRLFEATSRVDQEIIEFKSSKELSDYLKLQENHYGVFVRGFWESVSNQPESRRIKLNPEIGNFKYDFNGAGVFQLIQGRPHDLAENSLNLSRFSHWNEKGALQRANYSDDEITGVNWAEFKSLSGKLHRHIRNKMVRAKLFKRPILNGAYSDLEKGGKLFGQPGVYSLSSVEVES